MLSQISEDEFQIYAKEQCSCYYYMDKFSLSSLQMLNTNFHDYRNLNDFFSSLEAFNKKGKLQISESPTSNNASSYLKLYYSYEAFIPSTEVKITKEFEIKIGKVEVNNSEINLVELIEKLNRDMKELKENSIYN